MKSNGYAAFLWVVFCVLIIGIPINHVCAIGARVVDVDPPLNAHGTDPGDDITVTIDFPVDGGTVGPSTFIVNSRNYLDPTGPYSSSGYQFWLNPGRDFYPGESVCVTVTDGITADGGGLPVNQYVWEFTAAVNASNPVFTDSGQTLGTDERSSSAAFGDLDNDGDLDLVITEYDDPSVNRVLLNDGTGVFTQHSVITSIYVSDIALGDLDGDRDLDVFMVSGYSGYPDSVWINNGTGTFTSSGQPLNSEGSKGIDLGDLDGDGDLDAFVCTGGENHFTYINNGRGTFTTWTVPTISNFGADCKLADLDNDGDLDVYIAAYDYVKAMTNMVYLNYGNGMFYDSGQALGSNPSNCIDLGDLDGDGDADAYIGNDGADKIWFNDGTGTFTAGAQSFDSTWTYDVKLADIDGDSDLDVICFGGDTAIWLNDGTGTLTDSGNVIDTAGISGGAAGDIDGDGDLDLVFTRGYQPDQVWLNDEFSCIHDGDANLDNVLTAMDAQQTFETVLSMYTPTAEEACSSDCNGDDSITAGDAQVIFETVLGSNTCADPLIP